MEPFEVDEGVARSADPDFLRLSIGQARRLARAWGLSGLAPMPGASCSLVFSAHDPEGRPVVLRVPLGDEERSTGFLALRAFDGHGGVEVIQAHEPSGSVLMPRLDPGTTLPDDGTSDEAVAVCAQVVQRLREAPLEMGIPLGRWHRELLQSPSAHPFVTPAQRILRELLASTRALRLMHGDLHHENLLRHGDGWRVIDPKGVVGDPAFEVVAFFRNPVGAIDAWEDLPSIQARRLEAFHRELGDPIDRLWGWAFAHAVQSALWDGEREEWMRVPESLWTVRSEFVCGGWRPG